MQAPLHRQSNVAIEPPAGRNEAHFRRLYERNVRLVGAVLRQAGLRSADADDASQRVFMVLARKVEQIDERNVRAFLRQTARWVGSETLRSLARRREVLCTAERLASEPPWPSRPTERRCDKLAARQLLDRMPEPLRAIFVLHELEQLTMAEISEMLQIPAGTVASRLRRARGFVDATVRRIRSAEQLALAA